MKKRFFSLLLASMLVINGCSTSNSSNGVNNGNNSGSANNSENNNNSGNTSNFENLENNKELEYCENIIDKSSVREYYKEIAKKYSISRDTKENVRKM